MSYAEFIAKSERAFAKNKDDVKAFSHPIYTLNNLWKNDPENFKNEDGVILLEFIKAKQNIQQQHIQQQHIQHIQQQHIELFCNIFCKIPWNFTALTEEELQRINGLFDAKLGMCCVSSAFDSQAMNAMKVFIKAKLDVTTSISENTITERRKKMFIEDAMRMVKLGAM